MIDTPTQDRYSIHDQRKFRWKEFRSSTAREIYPKKLLNMSDFARTFARSKLSSLPPEPPLTEQDDLADDSSSASSMSSTGTIMPNATLKPAVNIHWSDFFEQELYLEQSLPEGGHGKFHVYLSPPATARSPLIILHHGAGSTAMSFALFAREIKKLMPEVGLLAVEAREHGSVVYTASGEVDDDLSLAKLSQDFVDMVQLTQNKLGWETLPQTLVVGHSLGGAVVTDTMKKGLLGSAIIGYAVLDVVEGSAMEALKHMQAYLASRPSTFPNIAAAVEWHIRSRTLRNIESAKASVPSLLIQTPTGQWAWRTSLAKTEAYWGDWFTHMSSKFLSGKGAKLLMLAGTDRLDKELMIGQMQGKFQLQVLPAAGHFLQEDLPEKSAEIIVEFLKRNNRNALVLPPKVGDLLKQGVKV